MENGDILSPATVLEHEIDHMNNSATNPKEHKKNVGKPMKNYSNTEEYRVITGSETHTAKANGEIATSKSQSRYSHGSNKLVSVKTKGPTSNVPINEK